MIYEYTNNKGITYYLHSKEVVLRGGNRKQTIYFFSKKQEGGLSEVPAGFTVVENTRTGLPVLKRA
jgi:hypothetical protein